MTCDERVAKAKQIICTVYGSPTARFNLTGFRCPKEVKLSQSTTQPRETLVGRVR
jgi:hypothetical protein